MVDQIEDLIFSSLCESIKNWDKAKRSFHDAADTLRAQQIGKMIDQTKREIEEEVNSLLSGKGSNKRIATGKVKSLHVFKLSVQEEDNHSEDRVPFKVWNMMTNYYQDALRRGGIIDIGLVRYDATNTGKHVRVGCNHSSRRAELSYYI